MSYCKITIQDKEVGLKFAHLSNKLFWTAYVGKRDLYTAGENLSDLGFAKLFHCAYINNCEIKEANIELTVEDFYNWIENLDDKGQEEFINAHDVWNNAQSTKEFIKKLNELLGEPNIKKSKKKKSPISTP